LELRIPHELERGLDVPPFALRRLPTCRARRTAAIDPDDGRHWESAKARKQSSPRPRVPYVLTSAQPFEAPRQHTRKILAEDGGSEGRVRCFSEQPGVTVAESPRCA